MPMEGVLTEWVSLWGLCPMLSWPRPDPPSPSSPTVSQACGEKAALRTAQRCLNSGSATSCVTLGQSLNFSEPVSSSQSGGNKDTSTWGCWKM